VAYVDAWSREEEERREEREVVEYTDRQLRARNSYSTLKWHIIFLPALPVATGLSQGAERQ
jgi:hypothetical protein